MPTVQQIDSFAHGVFSTAGGGLYANVSGTPSRDTTIVRGNDPCSILFNPANSATSRNQFPNLPTVGPRGWSGFGVRVEQYPNSDNPIVQMWTQAGRALQFYLLSSSAYLSISGGSTQGFALQSSTWYWIEFIYDVSGTTHNAYWQVNGVDQTSIPATGLTADNYIELDIGVCSATTTSPIVRFSCVLNGTAASSTDWLGEQTMRAVVANGVGTHNLDASTSTFFFQNTGSDVAITNVETNSYQVVDDMPFAGTDFLKITGATPTNTWYVEHDYPALAASAGPTAVRCVHGLQNDTGTLANVIGAKITDDGGTSLSNVYTSLSLGSATPIYKAATFASKPSGGAWTAGAFDSIRRRWGYSNDASPAPELLYEIIDVAFPITTQFASYYNAPIHPFPEQRFGAL